MARGRGGSLRLPRTTLSFASPSRFIPALSGARYLAHIYPYPTLRVRPHDRPRMAWGRIGSLDLIRMISAITASCRFIPTLSLHHCVPRVLGGSTNAANRVLLHPECHGRVHHQRIAVSKSRLSLGGV